MSIKLQCASCLLLVANVAALTNLTNATCASSGFGLCEPGEQFCVPCDCCWLGGSCNACGKGHYIDSGCRSQMGGRDMIGTGHIVDVLHTGGQAKPPSPKH